MTEGDRKGRTWSTTAYEKVSIQATKGGTVSATSEAEQRMLQGETLDPMVDPKGPAHLGPIRLSLPRFEKAGKYWKLLHGVPLAIETALDTTGSMGNNVDLAFEALPFFYDMLKIGDNPILAKYDPQILTTIFNDVMDFVYSNGKKPVMCRTQFEMDERIAMQMTNLVPGKGGCGNNKEDPQYALFGAAYLTNAAIHTRWGLKSYHFTGSDELTDTTVTLKWLTQIYGPDVLERCKENGFELDLNNLPDTADIIAELKTKAHAFFLQVPGSYDRAVKQQWTDLYGPEYFVTIPGNTRYLHCVQATVVGLTEGVLTLESAEKFLTDRKVPKSQARLIVGAVEHIPLAAQTLHPNFKRLPKPGDLFERKTDLWPVDQSKVELDAAKPKVIELERKGTTWL
jgi:hypothetical protein